MSLTDQISIVNGEEPERRYTATFTAFERTYITKAILKIPQHITAIEEVHMIRNLITKLGTGYFHLGSVHMGNVRESVLLSWAWLSVFARLV